MKIVAVYNTCGISNKDNVDYYIQAIESIIGQNQYNYKLDILLSSCLNHKEHRKRLEGRFHDTIDYCYFDERLTVNQTFNKACQEYVKRKGLPDEFLYIDSGCILTDEDTIEKMVDVCKEQIYGMVTAPVDVDHAFPGCFGFDYPPPNYDVPVGKACNLHVQTFNKKIFKAFEDRIIPDCFASFSTESVFSFLNACVNMKWRILNNVVVKHSHSMDGASSGFGHGYHLLPESSHSIDKVVSDEEGTNCGFGYEECRPVKLHKPECFDSDGFAIYPERLRKFMLNNIFLSEEKFDYNNIRYVYK